MKLTVVKTLRESLQKMLTHHTNENSGEFDIKSVICNNDLICNLDAEKVCEYENNSTVDDIDDLIDHCGIT